MIFNHDRKKLIDKMYETPNPGSIPRYWQIKAKKEKTKPIRLLKTIARIFVVIVSFYLCSTFPNAYL